MPLVIAVEVSPHWVLTLLGLLAIPALIALNGFFVAAEFSLVAVRKTRIEELIQQGTRGADAVMKAISQLDRTIAATQLGITLASIALGMACEPALVRVLEPVFNELPAPLFFLAKHSVASVLAFGLITFMHVVFGELIPKSVALQEAEQTSLWVARPLIVFARLTRPLISLMNGTGNRLLRWAGFEAATGEESVHSVEELILLIEDVEEAGHLEPEEADLVENVFRLRNKKVKDCMVPREKMATLELHASPDHILEAVRAGAHTRMPVYDSDLDNIVGIVNTKDLFHLYSIRGVAVLEDALYPPIFLSPDESIATALQLFRKSRKMMALVRDESGKILGLITLEDILEEIVGDIEDEHDRPMRRVRPRWRRKRK
jgi:CBS domain containing-hemolysin-like protein